MSHRRLPAALRSLLGRVGSGPKLGLAAMRQALAVLDDPHRGLAAVHVGGTNGKGSACAMVERVARAAGLRTGLYTSPHLCRFNERIRIDGQPIDDEPFAAALEAALDPGLPPLSFFEAMTAAAFWAMREAEVELAVVEVGLGGRLDATNALEAPLVTAITSIDVDHRAYLGDDATTIAYEKAGIIKPGRPLVLGPMAAGPARAIQRVAKRVGAGPIRRVEPSASAVGQSAGAIAAAMAADGRVEIRGLSAGPVRARLNLAGRHQAENAAVAAGIVEQLDAVAWHPQRKAGPLVAHLGRGLEHTCWPGRLEPIRHRGVWVVLDGAHNRAAAAALQAWLTDHARPERTTLVFGALADKPWSEMLALLGPRAATRYYTEPPLALASRRAVAPSQLSARYPGRIVGAAEQTIEHAVSHAGADHTVVVTGSIFLVGAVRAALLGLERDVLLPL